MNATHAKKLIAFDADFSFDEIDRSLHSRPGVYCLYCKKTQRAYIGGTGDCKERIRKHFQRLTFGDHPCKQMLEHYQEHGRESFSAFVLEYCEDSQIQEIEKTWINEFGQPRVYNKTGFVKTMEGTYTIRELCDELGVKYDTMRIAWRRNGLENFDQHRHATPEELSAMKAYYAKNLKVKTQSRSAKKTDENATSVREQQREKSVLIPIAPVVSKVSPPALVSAQNFTLPALADVRRFALDIILIGLVVGHAGLIWYDCSQLWAVPGQVGGGLAFFIVVAALMLATDPSKNITSQIALTLVFLIDFAAWFVHRPVFESYRADGTVTDVLCGFLCGMSFGALLIYRHQKNN